MFLIRAGPPPPVLSKGKVNQAALPLQSTLDHQATCVVSDPVPRLEPCLLIARTHQSAGQTVVIKSTFSNLKRRERFNTSLAGPDDVDQEERQNRF